MAEHRAAHGACYAVPADLDDRLQAHPAWGQVRTVLFSSGESGLAHLGLLLADLPKYHIGQWSTDPRPDVVALLCRCPMLPGWQLLQQASCQSFSFDIPWQRLRLLDSLLTPRANPYFQGSDIDAPPLNRTLRLGGYLVVRELLRHGIIRSRLAVPYAYAPIDRVQGLFAGFGVPINGAREIYAFLCTHLGEEEAAFNGDYDIPLRIVAADEGWQDIHFR